jgi:hypothetical protein
LCCKFSREELGIHSLCLISKNKGAVRVSNWAQETLTQGQIIYAGLDSYCGLVCADHVLNKQTGTFKCRPDPGTIVNVISKTGDMLLAKASVVDFKEAKFEGKALVVKGSERVVVKITQVISGGAFLIYPYVSSSNTSIEKVKKDPRSNSLVSVQVRIFYGI